MAHILDHLTNARMFYSILFYIDKYAILAFIMVNMWYTYGCPRGIHMYTRSDLQCSSIMVSRMDYTWLHNVEFTSGTCVDCSVGAIGHSYGLLVVYVI
jgi:hypothetical protein